MMKKRLHLLLCLLLFSTLGFAQSKISGVVNDENGSPLVGAIIVEKGTTNGTATDVDGKFSLNTESGATLVVSFVGFTAQEISVANQTSFDVILKENTGLNEVVVTALGISREKKSLGYAVQELSGADITAAPEVSPIQNLAGQIAGLTLTKGTYGPGSSTRVILRGERLVGGDNQPLYVIDGIPLDNSQNGAGPGEFNGADNGDGISNLNPDDIESISVLKGANAAALYGSRANNGVIIITTKKGKTGKTRISYSTNYSTESPSFQLKFQDAFAQGDAGRFAAGSDNSWGGKIDTTKFSFAGANYTAKSEDHIGAFLKNGNTWNNNLSITTGNEMVQTLFSVSALNSSGLVPNNVLDRLSLNSRTTAKLTSFLDWDVKATYINQRHKNRPAGGEEFSNPYSDAVRMPVTFPVAVLENFEVIENNQPRQNFYGASAANFGNTILGNPYWVANRLQLDETRNRLIGMTSLTARLAKGLSLIGRVGLDRYEDFAERKTFAGTPTGLTNTSISGNYSTAKYKVSELNADALLKYETTVKDFGFSIAAGTNTRRNSAQSGFSNAGGLDYLNVFSFNNGRVQSTGESGPGKRIINSVYGLANLSYKDFLFLDITGRNDWTSTLSPANNSYFYPSVSASAVLSEAFKMPDFISFAKIRGSYAEVGNDVSPYSLAQYLNASSGVVGAILANSTTRVIGESLLPQQTKSVEFGADLRFVQNRLGLDFSWYKTNTINQVLAETGIASQGFTSELLNAGDISNQGIELLLRATPIKSKDLKWDVTVNFARNRNKVERLSEKLNNYGFASNRITITTAKVGDRLGEIFVKGFERSSSGAIIVDTTSGLPVFTTGRSVYVGNVAPDWTAGVRNAVTFKGLTLDFLFDFRIGGVVVSHTQAVLHAVGKAEGTVVDGKRDNIVVEGVIGKKNADNTWSATANANTKPISPETYWKRIGGRGEPIGEAFVYDASVARLRQLTLSYALPTSIVKSIRMQGLSVGVYGRNLWFKTKEAPFDPEVALNTGLGGQGIDFYGMPTTRNLGVSLNATF
jgi:TonB-linked SusC/RagA family outer membrane protein